MWLLFSAAPAAVSTEVGMAVMLGGRGTLGVGVAISGPGRGLLAEGDGRESAERRPERESAWGNRTGHVR